MLNEQPQPHNPIFPSPHQPSDSQTEEHNVDPGSNQQETNITTDDPKNTESLGPDGYVFETKSRKRRSRSAHIGQSKRQKLSRRDAKRPSTAVLRTRTKTISQIEDQSRSRQRIEVNNVSTYFSNNADCARRMMRALEHQEW